jgi:ribosomal protein S12
MGEKPMLEERGIRKGIEVLVHDPNAPNQPARKAVVIRTYPRPSRWFVVRYESGDMAQVEETQVTTMFEEYKKGIF